jgi:FHA domain
MDLPQILLTAAIGLLASLVTAVVTHTLTKSRERQKYELAREQDLHRHQREVAAGLAELNSYDPNVTQVFATQHAAACLIVERTKDQERERFFLPVGSRLTFGRSPQNNIQIEEPLLSKTHGAFSSRGSECFIEPLGGAPPLSINSNVIAKPEKLSVGDVITVGHAEFKITFVPLSG